MPCLIPWKSHSKRETMTWKRTERFSQGHALGYGGQAGLEPGTTPVHCLQLGTLFPSPVCFSTVKNACSNERDGCVR